MLERPDLPDHRVAACLQDTYELRVSDVAFLPLGADQNTAVYRVTTNNSTPYFVKLRRGPFDEIAVTVPAYPQRARASARSSRPCRPGPGGSGRSWTHSR